MQIESITMTSYSAAECVLLQLFKELVHFLICIVIDSEVMFSLKVFISMFLYTSSRSLCMLLFCFPFLRQYVQPIRHGYPLLHDSGECSSRIRLR